MAKKETQQAELTVKDLASRAGVSDADLRRLIRSKFGKIGRGKRYTWAANDPVVEQIIEASKGQTEEATTQEATTTEG